ADHSAWRFRHAHAARFPRLIDRIEGKNPSAARAFDAVEGRIHHRLGLSPALDYCDRSGGGQSRSLPRRRLKKGEAFRKAWRGVALEGFTPDRQRDRSAGCLDEWVPGADVSGPAVAPGAANTAAQAGSVLGFGKVP